MSIPDCCVDPGRWRIGVFPRDPILTICYSRTFRIIARSKCFITIGSPHLKWAHPISLGQWSLESWRMFQGNHPQVKGRRIQLGDILSGWWFGTWILFFHVLGISSSQLTKSIIFQRGNPSYSPCTLPLPKHRRIQCGASSPSWAMNKIPWLIGHFREFYYPIYWGML